MSIVGPTLCFERQYADRIPEVTFIFFNVFPLISFIYVDICLTYNVVLVSNVQHSDSVIHTHIQILYILFQILSYYRSLQDIVYSSLCYTVGLCCLPILYIVLSNQSILKEISPGISLEGLMLKLKLQRM